MRFSPVIPAALFLLPALAMGQNRSSAPPSGYVDIPVSGSHSGLPFIGGRSLDEPSILPLHPPISEIPPIPVPTSTWQGPEQLYAPMTYHDAITGYTQELPGTVPTVGGEPMISTEPVNRGVGAYDPYIENMFGFGTRSVAGNLDSFPRSPNCKLVMAFTDTTGTQWWFVASGTMGDPGVVLTAAHCVYTRTFTSGGTTYTVNDWADIMYVYPGWDGNGSPVPPGSSDEFQNWGYAYGTSFMAGSDYINNGNLDRDCGLIGITRGGSRNVGMLTGYFGWASGFSCSTIMGRTHHNFGYPAASCSATLHTGRTMYYWNGSYDLCDWAGSNQMTINTGNSCLDRYWGGDSGSGVYYIDSASGNRYQETIHSNSTTSSPWRGQDVKLWGQFTTDMVAFEGTIRTSSEDWEPLMFRATGSTTVEAGQAMDAGCEVQMVNATDADPASQNYVMEIYLSTNNNISTSDTLLATWTYNLDAGPMANRKFNVPAPVIPAGTPAGTYWLGTIADVGLPGTSTNDDTDTWDAQQITVTDPPPVLETLWWDDFESGGLTFGGWTKKGNKVKVNTKAAYTGTYGLRLRKKQWAEVAVPTTGYDTLHLMVDRRSSKRYDSGESFKIRWTVGSGWNDLDVSSGDAWGGNLVFNLPAGAENNSNFRLRFKSYGNLRNEWGDVDNLALMGWK